MNGEWTREWFEQTMIARALAGDTEDARYVLAECAEGVQMGTLSDHLRKYLHDRLCEVVNGVEPAKALRIARPARKPRDPFPGWEEPLAAFAALLAKRRRGPEEIIGAMDEARQIIEGKGLSRTEAQRIRKTYAPMRELERELLRHLLLFRSPRRGEPRGAGSVPRFPRATARALRALLVRSSRS
ncbi:MAG TPA: hypothetical protein VIY30_16255 [Burkholderiaceae bacterium]